MFPFLETSLDNSWYITSSRTVRGIQSLKKETNKKHQLIYSKDQNSASTLGNIKNIKNKFNKTRIDMAIGNRNHMIIKLNKLFVSLKKYLQQAIACGDKKQLVDKRTHYKMLDRNTVLGDGTDHLLNAH